MRNHRYRLGVISKPDMTSGKAVVYEKDAFDTLIEGSPLDANLFPCGEGKLFRLGDKCQTLLDLHFVRRSLASDRGRPSKRKMTAKEIQKGYVLGKAQYENRVPLKRHV